MDLVWDVERCLGAVHYDALLRIPGGGTISLAYTVPGHGVPWALRHAHHARESDLLRVNGRTLTMQTVMGYLDGLWHDARLVAALRRWMSGARSRGRAGNRGDRQRGARATEKFERREGFADLDARYAWLRRRGWTPDDLEHEIRRQVIALKLRKQIAKGRIDSYFARRQRELDAAFVARCACRAATLPSVRPPRPERLGSIGRWSRQSRKRRSPRTGLNSSASAAATSRLPMRTRCLPRRRAQVLGPFARDGGYDVVRVLRMARARLDEATRTLITALLFEEWLEERRAGAAVEWFWGDVERAAGSASVFGRRR